MEMESRTGTFAILDCGYCMGSRFDVLPQKVWGKGLAEGKDTIASGLQTWFQYIVVYKRI